MLWAGCWIQNRKPGLGTVTEIDPDRVVAWEDDPPRVLDTLLSTLSAYLSSLLRRESAEGREIHFPISDFTKRSPAYWSTKDCLGGDLSATRRELAAKYPVRIRFLSKIYSFQTPSYRLSFQTLNIGSNAAPPTVGVAASVLRVCAMLFPDRAFRLDLDPILEPLSSRSNLSSALVRN